MRDKNGVVAQNRGVELVRTDFARLAGMLVLKKLIVIVGGLAIGFAAGGYFARQEFADDTRPGKLMFSEDDAPNPNDRERPPRVIIVNGEQFQFGTMQRWATQSHDFELRNEGGQPLTLEAGETSCKCTLSKLANPNDESSKGTKTTLMPGEATKVTLTWTAKTHEPEFHQSAEIHTNDPLNPSVRLLVHGKVVESVWSEPREIVLNNLINGERNAIQVKVLSSMPDKIELKNPEWSIPTEESLFDIEFKPMPEEVLKEFKQATSGMMVVITPKEELPLGRFERLLKMGCNLPEIPTMELPIRGVVVGDISIAGPKYSPAVSRLDLGLIEQSAGLSTTLFVTVKGPLRDATEVKVLQVEPAGILEATLGEVDPGVTNLKRIPLHVKLAPGVAIGDFTGNGTNPGGKIVLETTHPRIKRIEIRVTFVVK